MDMSRDTISFSYTPSDENKFGIPVYLSFEVPEDLSCVKLADLCRYFALVLSYSPETIDKYFNVPEDEL